MSADKRLPPRQAAKKPPRRRFFCSLEWSSMGAGAVSAPFSNPCQKMGGAFIMVRFEKLTVKAQEALQDAQEVAARHENQEITPLHLLAALASQADGVVPPLLARLGIRQEVLSSDVERELGRLPKDQGFSEQRMGRSLNDALERAFKEAEKFKDEYVSTEHLFLAIAGSDRDPAGQILKKSGPSHETNP